MRKNIGTKATVFVYDRFTVNVRGKKFIRYAGLLSLAHQRGLTSLTTEFVRELSNLDKGVITFKAIATCGEQIFTGHGDATTKNVSKMVLPHLIRVAETRAMARALRMFVGCEFTALEELSENDFKEKGSKS